MKIHVSKGKTCFSLWLLKCIWLNQGKSYNAMQFNINIETRVKGTFNVPWSELEKFVRFGWPRRK